jgi:hypothetical protein
VGVDKQCQRHGPKHAEGAEGHTEHAAELVRHEHGDRKAAHGHDARKVAPSEAVNDACGRRLLLRLGELPHGNISARGEIFRREADDETRPPPKQDGDGARFRRKVRDTLRHVEFGRQTVPRKHPHNKRHQHGADDEDQFSPRSTCAGSRTWYRPQTGRVTTPTTMPVEETRSGYI